MSPTLGTWCWLGFLGSTHNRVMKSPQPWRWGEGHQVTRGEEGHRDAGTRGRQSRAVTRTPGLALSVLGTHVNLAFLKTLGNTGTGASTFFTEGPQVLSGGGPVCTRGRSCGASSPPLCVASEEAPDGGDTPAECCPVPTGSASLRGRCVPAEGPLTAAAPALRRTSGSVPSPGAVRGTEPVAAGPLNPEPPLRLLVLRGGLG